VFGPSIDFGCNPGALELFAQQPAQLKNVLLPIRAALLKRQSDAAVLSALEMAERQILKLPLDLPDAQAACERREHRTGLKGEALTLRHPQVPGMAYLYEMFCKSREHEPRVAHDREQHFAHGLSLTWAKALDSRPVAWQPELAQILKVSGGAGGAGGDQPGELLYAQTCEAQRGPYEDGAGKLLAPGQGCYDLRRFNSEYDAQR
jgi:hypothetical protein